MKKLDNMLKSMAIGDHNGYQYENMNRDLVRKINPQFKKTVIKGKPLTDSTITDDTEHMILTYLALKTTHNLSEKDFALELEKNMKRWFSTFPVGIGKATLNACMKLTFFKKNYSNAGYFSAGNGPLMRAPIIAALYHNKEDKRKNYIKIATKITHTDPLAELAAQSVADIISLLSNNNISNAKSLFLTKVLSIIENVLNKVETSPESIMVWNKFYSEIAGIASKNYQEYMDKYFNKGVSGFALDTLKMAILQIYHFNDLQTIVENCVLAGGDTDSTAGIVAAIYSVTDKDLHADCDIEMNALFNIINGSYSYRLFYSMMEWVRSLTSLWRFIYVFKR